MFPLPPLVWYPAIEESLCQYPTRLRSEDRSDAFSSALFPRFAALFICGAANAQSWDTYSNQENFFSVNFPGTPVTTQASLQDGQGHAADGEDLHRGRSPQARGWPGPIRSRSSTIPTPRTRSWPPTEFAADVIRKKGTVKYDAIENTDLHATPPSDRRDGHRPDPGGDSFRGEQIASTFRPPRTP